jgi:hypothetical protein
MLTLTFHTASEKPPKIGDSIYWLSNPHDEPHIYKGVVGTIVAENRYALNTGHVLFEDDLYITAEDWWWANENKT